MKTILIVLGAVAAGLVILAIGIWIGVNLSQAQWWGFGMMGAPWDLDEWFGGQMRGPGFMERGIPMAPQPYAEPKEAQFDSLEEAREAFEGYIDQLGLDGLAVTEVMEFELNYYAIVTEEDTGIGAMELLIDKDNGWVGPEPGPNMMWNVKYGMHGGWRGGMMGPSGATEMVLSAEEAEDVAQRWLNGNRPGRTAGEADRFYGYYTLHFLNQGEIEGMLSVHGSTGEIWYHSWHGDFIDLIGEHGHE